MSGLGNNRRGAWRGALAGVACGVLATVLYFLYYQVTSPSPYNIIFLIYAPVFMTFGGMAGLLVWAMRDSESVEVGRRDAARGHERESLPDKRRRLSFWRGPAIGAACGALITLLWWLWLELTRPSAYGRLFVLTYGSVFVVFCAVAGLVFGATRDTD
jgi:hypothetical protein